MRRLAQCIMAVLLLSSMVGCIWVPGRETHHYYYYPEDRYAGPYPGPYY